METTRIYNGVYIGIILGYWKEKGNDYLVLYRDYIGVIGVIWDNGK